MTTAQDSPRQMDFFKGSFKDLLTKAEGSGKYIFVEFYSKKMEASKRMSKETFRDSVVQDYMEHNFELFRINGRSGVSAEYKLIRNYSIKQLPTFLVLNSQGKVLRRMSGHFTVKEWLNEFNRFTDVSLKQQTDHVVLASTADLQPAPSSQMRLSAAAKKVTELPSTDIEKTLSPATQGFSENIPLTAEPNGNAAFALSISDFSSFEEASKMVEGYKLVMKEDIRIHFNGLSYHLILGEFANENQAKIAKNKVLENTRVHTDVIKIKAESSVSLGSLR